MHILHHAAREPVYGLALLREIARHGYQLSAGTLYPILHDLESTGLVRREERVVAVKVRKYYSIAPAGEQALAEARQKIGELVAEVVHGNGPATLSDPGPGEDQ